MNKKILICLFTIVIGFTFCCCGGGQEKNFTGHQVGIKVENIKVGFLYIGSITDEGYTSSHEQGRLALEKALGVKTVYLENVPENADCEKAIRDLIAQGCNVIYSTSFGFKEWTAKVAKEHPEVYFGHATGDLMEKNMSNYMGRMYEVRYLAGIVAGKKTETKQIGYVAAVKIPEVIRGLNAFTLGVRSVNPEAKVKVLWTNTWNDPVMEKSIADELLNQNCDVIAQHCDSINPQIAAQNANAYAIGYHIATPHVAPKAYLTAAVFNWANFYIDDVKRVIEGTWKARSYWEGMDSGLVSLAELSENCAPGTAEAVEAAKKQILNQELFIFTGPLRDNAGAERIATGARMTDEQLLSFDWLVDGVVGSIQ